MRETTVARRKRPNNEAREETRHNAPRRSIFFHTAPDGKAFLFAGPKKRHQVHEGPCYRRAVLSTGYRGLLKENIVSFSSFLFLPASSLEDSSLTIKRGSPFFHFFFQPSLFHTPFPRPDCFLISCILRYFCIPSLARTGPGITVIQGVQGAREASLHLSFLLLLFFNPSSLSLPSDLQMPLFLFFSTSLNLRICVFFFNLFPPQRRRNGTSERELVVLLFWTQRFFFPLLLFGRKRICLLLLTSEVEGFQSHLRPVFSS